MIVVTVTGPAIAIALVVGYLGINSIAEWLRDQFKGKDDDRDRR